MANDVKIPQEFTASVLAYYGIPAGQSYYLKSEADAWDAMRVERIRELEKLLQTINAQAGGAAQGLLLHAVRAERDQLKSELDELRKAVGEDGK